jgi:hypothetical protein
VIIPDTDCCAKEITGRNASKSSGILLKMFEIVFVIIVCFFINVNKFKKKLTFYYELKRIINLFDI